MKASPLAWNRLRLDFLHKPCQLAKSAAAREECSRAARTRYGWTVVLAVAVLFAVFGSVGEVKVAVAVLVIVPLLVGFTTRSRSSVPGHSVGTIAWCGSTVVPTASARL